MYSPAHLWKCTCGTVKGDGQGAYHSRKCVRDFCDLKNHSDFGDFSSLIFVIFSKSVRVFRMICPLEMDRA